MSARDKAIPRDMLEHAQCVGIVPNLKRAGFIIGAKYGKGVLTCRVHEGEGWAAPSTIRIEGGSVGFQIGPGETDVVFIVNNSRGMEKLEKDKFTIGGDASSLGLIPHQRLKTDSIRPPSHPSYGAAGTGSSFFRSRSDR